ncbi:MULTISPECIES: SpoIVB peptidase S55 domain-containing protein [Bacillaceae]|uniref:SpoIVB peptidase S55 domain-containing protein n=1 Tax=Bacillaceae TaxID=186817 RepID=UPI0006F4421A|nr:MULTISPECIES: SpoIVB peptidase S55 domain-containing protein [Bacillaceae]MDF2066376.1 SpoIVB peptidase S55 domain-containing protein [Bacillus sp. Cr_A10]
MKPSYRIWSLITILFFTLFFAVNSTFAQNTTSSVVPLGQSIQIDLQYGAVVLGNDVLLTDDYWLRTGDAIKQVNSENVRTMEDVKTHIKDKEQITIHYERNKKMYTREITSDQILKLLPFLKDATEGIGTLTYFDLETNEFGALGHQIVDHPSGLTPSFSEGSIYLSSILQIKKSIPGKPGYKITSHQNNTSPIGGVNENNVYGIFGKLEKNAIENIPMQEVEVADKEAITTGKAIMRTSIDGEKVQDFSIEITTVEDYLFQFTVIDKTLIEKTGGILQGMSGSPIIQQDKLIGVVTHMYVDKPKNGAALSIKEMMKKNP